MGDVGRFPGFQQGAIRRIELQHSAGQLLRRLGVHFAKMHHRLPVGDGVQLHFCGVHLHRHRLFHGEVARQGSQFHDLERTVGGFKRKCPVGVRFCGSDGIFFGEFGCFSGEQPKCHTLQGSLLGPGFMAGDFAPQQLVVELYSGGFLGCHCDSLAGGNLIAGGHVGLLLRHGVLAGGQALDVDFSGAVGGESFGVTLALHQEREAL